MELDNNKINIRHQKENLVRNLINRISSEFLGKGIEERHIKKALKYYLSINEVTDNNVDLQMFNSVLDKIEQELYKLALNTEKNFIIELEFYNNPTPKNKIIENSHDKKNPSNDIPCQKKELSRPLDTEKTDNEIASDNNKTTQHQETITKNTEKTEETYSYEQLTRRKKISEMIEKIAKEYEGRGILEKHVIKAKEHYLSLLDKDYKNANEKEFETLLTYIENELYILAENTKKNYIKQLQSAILNNPKINLSERKQIMDKMYLSKNEKEKVVIKLIDTIAKEYSNDGVFDRHIKKAYNIFLNRPEVLNDNLSLEEFNKFIVKIEKELYGLAEQTKNNYEYYRKESEQYGKVLKKGEDIRWYGILLIRKRRVFINKIKSITIADNEERLRQISVPVDITNDENLLINSNKNTKNKIFTKKNLLENLEP